jgi:hypothetical protein
MPDPQKVLATIRKATVLFRGTPGRTGATVRPVDVEDVMVVGDLHGNTPAFRGILEAAKMDAHPRRHLVLQELVHGPRHYTEDRGDKSHQLVDIVAALKCKYPDRLHVIMGNHELSEITGRSIAKAGIPLNGLFRLGVQTAYGDMAEPIMGAYHDLFRSFALAIRLPNRVMLCHTIPDGYDLDRVDLAALELDSFTPQQMARGGTVYALTWGRDDQPETIERFAQMADADLFITGHQPCDVGFRQANERQLIIDGTDPFPTYCVFPGNSAVTMEDLVKGVRVFSYDE